MDDMAAYYPPPAGLLHDPHYPYYQPLPPPPPLGAVQPPLPAMPQQPHHLPPQFHHHHQPQIRLLRAYYAPPPYPQFSDDQVRTLFIAGLPEDAKTREIYNLFREFPGYESSHLRSPTSTSQPFAFAVFMDQQSAMQALNN